MRHIKEESIITAVIKKFMETVLPTTPNCERALVPDGESEGTQVYQLRLEIALILLC